MLTTHATFEISLLDFSRFEKNPDSGHRFAKLKPTNFVATGGLHVEQDTKLRRAEAVLLSSVDQNCKGMNKIPIRRKLIGFWNDDKIETKNQTCGIS